MSGVPITLSNLANLQNDTSATNTINANSTSITNAFGSAFYRQGDQMQGNIDMNSNHIYNLPAPATQTEPLRVIDAANLTAGGTINVITRQTWPTPQDYGAVGDGVTNDTSAVQQLLNSGSDTIYIPGGIYLCNNINVPNNIKRIFGTGTLKYNGGNSGSTLSFNSFAVNGGTVIDGITIDNTSNSTTQPMIFINQTSGCTGLRINNVRFQGGSTSILLYDLAGGLYPFTSFEISDCSFISFVGGALLTASSASMSHLVFRDNTVFGDGTQNYHAVSIGTAGTKQNFNIEIHDNFIYNTGSADSINIGNCDGAVICDNNIAPSINGGNAISVRTFGGFTVAETVISNNTIYGLNSNTQGIGILVGNGDTNVSSFVNDVLITGNLIRYVGFQGIHVSSFGSNSVTNVTVSGNHIHNVGLSSASAGIFLGAFSIGGGSVRANKVVGNIVQGDTPATIFGIQLDSSTNSNNTFYNRVNLNSGTSYFDAGTNNSSDMGPTAFTRIYSNGNSVNVYVNPATGSDSTGDGTSGNPWKTISFAYYQAAKTYDGSSTGTNLLINLAAGNYAGQQLNIYGNPVGFSTVFISGNANNPSTCLFDGTGTTGSAFVMAQSTAGMLLTVDGIQLQNYTGGFETQGMSGSIALANITFAGGIGTCILVSGGGQVQAQGTLFYANNNGKGIYVSGSGSCFDMNASNISFLGGANFSSYFLFTESSGNIIWNVGTVSGSCTGNMSYINTGASIRAVSGGIDLYPHNIPGTPNTNRFSGGWFNNMVCTDFLNQTTGGLGHVSVLPTSMVSLGARTMVGDCSTTTFNAVATGGGGNVVPVFWNGSQWRVG